MIARNTQALLDLSGGAFDSRDFGKLVEAVYRVTVGRLAFARLSILAFDEKRGQWRTVACRDQQGRAVSTTRESGPIGEEALELAKKSCGSVHVVDDYWNEIYEEGSPLLPAEGTRSGMHAFLHRGAKLVGVYAVQHSDPKYYSESDARFLHEVAQTIAQPLAGVGDYRETVPAQYGEQPGTDQVKLKLSSDDGYDDIIGSSPALQDLLNVADRVASTDTTVLLLGETGTGKELIARAIHERSRRRRKPLMAINCAGFARELVSSELFGHDAGAFTGASANRKGRFELADRGTLFLDEIGDIPPETQVRLLRVLEEGEFQRVGSNKTIKTNVRIIAATHRNLEDMVAQGRFRADLFYRLNAFPIHVPRLRDRGSDVIELAVHFANLSAARVRKQVPTLSSDVIRAITQYHWIGNVRELRNVIERAVILCDGNRIELEHLPREVIYGGSNCVPQDPAALAGDPPSMHPGGVGAAGAGFTPPASPVQATTEPTPFEEGGSFTTLEEATRRHILAALNQCKGKISGKAGAAQLLNINAKTLESKMRKLGIRRSWQ